jgi:hypothetical protein
VIDGSALKTLLSPEKLVAESSGFELYGPFDLAARQSVS